MEEEKLLNLEGNENEVKVENPAEVEVEKTEAEETVGTPTAQTELPDTSSENTVPPVIEENGAIETSIKTFTQDDVDKLVGDTRVKTREKTFNYIYNRYGVKNEEELDSLVANAQRYDTLKEESDTARSEWEAKNNENSERLSKMSEEIALMKSGVDADRYEDVKLILKGKGMEVTTENIEAELATHPEWKKEEVKTEESVTAPTPAANPVPNEGEGEPAPTVKTRITTLGNEPKPAPQMSEEEEAEKLFKMKFH